jgi:hypothetical protein
MAVDRVVMRGGLRMSRAQSLRTFARISFGSPVRSRDLGLTMRVLPPAIPVPAALQAAPSTRSFTLRFRVKSAHEEWDKIVSLSRQHGRCLYAMAHDRSLGGFAPR